MEEAATVPFEKVAPEGGKHSLERRPTLIEKARIKLWKMRMEPPKTLKAVRKVYEFMTGPYTTAAAVGAAVLTTAFLTAEKPGGEQQTPETSTPPASTAPASPDATVNSGPPILAPTTP